MRLDHSLFFRRPLCFFCQWMFLTSHRHKGGSGSDNLNDHQMLKGTMCSSFCGHQCVSNGDGMLGLARLVSGGRLSWFKTNSLLETHLHARLRRSCICEQVDKWQLARIDAGFHTLERPCQESDGNEWSVRRRPDVAQSKGTVYCSTSDTTRTDGPSGKTTAWCKPVPSSQPHDLSLVDPWYRSDRVFPGHVG